VPQVAKPSSRKHLFSDSHVPQTGKKNWKIKQTSGVVGKQISVLFVTDTHCEIGQVNERC
jgi:hypothetical protein